MWRRAVVVGFLVIGSFFIVRAVVELLTVHYSDPSSYRNDWGGPSLIGVLLVHCLPGLLAVVAIAFFVRRRRSRAEE
jgi:hypothetical protein